jgi:hypothetical protein
MSEEQAKQVEEDVARIVSMVRALGPSHSHHVLDLVKAYAERHAPHGK